MTHEDLPNITAKAKHEHHNRVGASAVPVKASNYCVHMRKTLGREIEFLLLYVPSGIYGYLSMLGRVFWYWCVLESQLHKKVK